MSAGVTVYIADAAKLARWADRMGVLVEACGSDVDAGCAVVRHCAWRSLAAVLVGGAAFGSGFVILLLVSGRAAWSAVPLVMLSVVARFYERRNERRSDEALARVRRANGVAHGINEAMGALLEESDIEGPPEGLS